MEICQKIKRPFSDYIKFFSLYPFMNGIVGFLLTSFLLPFFYIYEHKLFSLLFFFCF